MRLGLSQPAFAALAGASKGSQANWEKDDASPNAAALVAFAEAGADVLYILTGERAERSSSFQGERTAEQQEQFSEASDAAAQIDEFKRLLEVTSDDEFSAILGYNPRTIARWRARGGLTDEAYNVIATHIEFRRRNEQARDTFSGLNASKRQFAKALVIRYLVETTEVEDGDLEPDGLLFRAIEMDNFELSASRLLDQEMSNGAKNMLSAYRKLLASDLVMRLSKELTSMLHDAR